MSVFDFQVWNMRLGMRAPPVTAISASHALALRIEQRLALRPGLVALADDLDLEALVIALDLLRHIAERHRLCSIVGIAARGDPANHLALVPDRLVADDIDILGVDGESEEPEHTTRLLLLQRTIAADEIVLLERDETAEAGFERAIDRAVFARP